MGERERKTLLYGGVAIALILVFNFLIYPALEKLKEAKVNIEIKREELKQLVALGERFNTLSNSAVEGKVVESLFSYLSSIAQRLNLGDKLVYIKPLGKERYELKFESLNNEELVKLLSEIERDGIAIIREAEIKAGGNPRQASLALVVSTLE